MALGTISAFISGLGIAAWLVMLAKSLDKFSTLGKLIQEIGNTGGLSEVLQTELNRLVAGSFVIGFIALISGSLYCAIWTYTGRTAGLTHQEKVRAIGTVVVAVAARVVNIIALLQDSSSS